MSESTKKLHQSIEFAAKLKNPLEPFINEFSKFTTDDCDVSIYCKWKSDMDAKTLKWAFKLAERNVSPFYKTGPIGWQPKVKQSDLNKNWARYMVAVDKQKNPVAYAMFRFDLDYGNSVLYWWVSIRLNCLHFDQKLIFMCISMYLNTVMKCKWKKNINEGAWENFLWKRLKRWHDTTKWKDWNWLF